MSMHFHYYLLSPNGNGCGHSYKEACMSFTQRCVVSLLEISLVVLEKIFMLYMHFHCVLLSPIGKGLWFFYWIMLNAQGCFVLSLIKMRQVVLEKILKIFNGFSLFVLISPSKWTRSFVWRKLICPLLKNTLYQVWIVLET